MISWSPRRSSKFKRLLFLLLISLVCCYFLYVWISCSLDVAANEPRDYFKFSWEEYMKQKPPNGFNKNLSNQEVHKFTPSPNVNCADYPQSGYLFCRAGADPMERAIDLVSRLTLLEMLDQTTTVASSIPRLGIKMYNWRSNCLHGWSASKGHWRNDLKWTVFPAPIGLGATFNPDLIEAVGEVTSTEGRALHNEMLVFFSGSSTEAAGLNCFSPNVNILRDPRWGRAQETFGEDPYLVSILGNAYTRGLQGDPNNGYLKVAACAKHYAAHSGPEEVRMSFVANVTLHDLHDTYLPAFKSQVVGAKVAQIMTAYSGLRCKNQKDGAPDVANSYLLKTILRGEYGAPNISTVSDNLAVISVKNDHHYVKSYEEAAAVSMQATTDLDLGFDFIYPKYLLMSIRLDLVNIDTIRQAVTRSFYLRMLLGDFDPPTKVPYQFLNKANLGTKMHRELNLRAARESIVLLKNLDNALPLKKDLIKKIVVMGPNANSSRVLLGNYQGRPDKTVTVLQGIQSYLEGTAVAVKYVESCDTECPFLNTLTMENEIIHNADYVVMVMGLDNTIEEEGFDRRMTSCNNQFIPLLGLPGCQKTLVERVLQVNPRVILVLLNGGPLSIPILYHNNNIKGIIEAFYPGAVGGTAVAEVLFGAYNPGGKMPASIYMEEDDLPSFSDYSMRDRTYRYSTIQPLIPFGFGLSYSEFKYSALIISKKNINLCEDLFVHVTVENITPHVPGDEVIQLYLHNPFNYPKSKLVGFKRVHLFPHSPQTFAFKITPYQMSLVNMKGEHSFLPGKYMVVVGHNSKMNGTFTLNGNSKGAERVTVDVCYSSPHCLAC